MKIVLKSLLVFIILYFGFNIYNSARNNRINHLYNDAIQDIILDDEKDIYIEKSMITNGVTKYIEKPVFTVKGKNGFDFELRAYHFQKSNGKEVEEGIKFFLFDFEKENFNGFLKNPDAYEKNNSLAILSLRINSNNSVLSKELSLGQHAQDESNPKSGMTQTTDIYDNSVYFDFTTGLYYFKDVNGIRATFDDMVSIEFTILEMKDAANSKDYYETKIGTITASDNVELFQEFDAVRDGNSFKVEALNSDFGVYSELRKRYNNTNDDEVLSVNMKLLNEYNGPVIRNTTVYAVFASIIIGAMFLYTPIKERINHSKAIKQQKNK